MQNKKFKAVLFDKDGVLIDTLDLCWEAFNITLEHYGRPALSKEEYLNQGWGIELGENVKRIFAGSPKSKIEEIIDFYRKERMRLKNRTKIYPSVIPLLEAIKGKYKLAVVTNTLESTAAQILKDLGILEYFDIVVGKDDETKPKPAPDMILKACKLLGIETAEALYIGDTLPDIEAGKAAGCTTVIITTSMRKEELADIGGITIIDDLKELKEILGIA